MSAERLRPEDCLIGGGGMGELMRAKDWSQTPLGPVAEWPQSLRTSVSTCLNSRFPILIWWGPDFVKLYNDAYREIIAEKHPRALGQRGRECWPEIWPIIGPMLTGVLERGEATWSENQLLFLERHGFPEECYFTFAYSPIRDETGGIGGVFSVVSETTPQVVGNRRLRTFRDLAADATAGKSEADCWSDLVRTLSTNPLDLPIAVLYRATTEGGDFERIGDAFDLTSLAPRMSADSLVAWRDLGPRHQLLPIARPGLPPYGFLAARISERRPLDDDYRAFLRLVCDHVAAAISNARAYDEERRRAAALAELDRAKTTFFSNVSHEFRTPLTLILGPLEDGLADTHGPLPPAQRERQLVIRRSALRLQKLVNSLLDFSRIEAGRADARYVPTDLAALTADLASSFRSAVEKAGLALMVDCEPLPQPAYVDRDMWEKIVLNLLSNALKFTFEGSITVRLRLMDGSFVLEVSDTGVGIRPEHAGLVFERFRRVEGGRSRTHEGTGIGLALAQELARLHGGAIALESALGKGSTFRVTIPAGRAHLPADHVEDDTASARGTLGAQPFVEEALRWLPSDAAETPAEAAATAAEDALIGTAPGPRARIVLADDNADMRDYLRRLLSTRYEVEAVADGEAALDACRRLRPALLLSDVMMPRIDGLSLVRTLRADARTRSVPVMLLSARADPESRIEALEAGAQDYVYKPFHARELLARVAARIELSRLEAALERERAALSDLFAQTPIPTAVLRGPDLVFEMANPAYRAVIARDDVVGQPFAAALPELVAQGFDVLLHDVMRSGTAYVGHDRLARIARNGVMEDRYFDLIYAPLRGAGGVVDGVIVIATEVTEQVRARRELQEADRRKDEFLATLAHELRNPLAPIRSATMLLRQRRDDPALARKATDILERQVGHMVRLVDDLLDLSRISTGRLSIEQRDVRVREIVDAAVEISRPNVDAGKHRLEVRLPADPVVVRGDPVRLAQVVANVLNNAAKYTPTGGDIALEVREQGNEALVIVRDTGIGFPVDMRERIFEMFTRVDHELTRRTGGLGIGLALSRKLVELHGGRMEARSAGIGKGSEFVIHLPAARAAAAAATVPGAALPASAPLRVLVVDDNVDAAESLAMLLETLGHEVRLAHDGASALALVETDPPDVILLDIGLPVVDGFTVAQRLRGDRRFAAMRIVALSGYGRDQDLARGRDAGFDEHLVKPVDVGRLRAAMRC